MIGSIVKFVCLFNLLGCVLAADNKLSVTSQGCKIVEPVYNNTFDFTPLNSDLEHNIRTKKGDIFKFNICGSLSSQCKGKAKAGACLVKNDKEYLLGENHTLSYNDGKIYFTFTGGEKCATNGNYSLIIIVSCDYIMDIQQFSVKPYGDDECSFYIVWRTKYACLPEPDNVKSNTCALTDENTGHKYNLMPLSDTNHRVNDRSDSFFIINVCKPVLYEPNAMCPLGTSICFVNKSSTAIKDKFLNFGTVVPQPKVENKQLLMRFTSDIKCDGKMNISSVIYFYCDSGIKFGQPDFMGRRGCLYKFTWATSFACGETKSCAAFDPSTGLKYDFSALSGKLYTASHDENQYTFGICSDPGTPCLEHDGACLKFKDQTTSLGRTTNSLKFNETSSPYLLYETGAQCGKNNQQRWSTKIEFVCASENLPVGPKLVENTNCQVVIHFVTDLACQTQVSCKAENFDTGNEIDLTSLISSKSNYVARVNNTVKTKPSEKFFLNVCRPLVPQFGLSCPAGSAACKAVVGTSTPEQEESLGFPDVSLTMIEDSKAELKYFRGSRCPADSMSQMSTSITFYCDFKAGRGTPILQAIAENCHYQFEWPTNLICPPHKCDFDVDNCAIINHDTSQKLSMKSGKFTDAGKITVKTDPKPFIIDLCGPNRRAVTDYLQSTVKVFFNANGPCGLDGTDNISVELRLVCSDTEHRSSSSDLQFIFKSTVDFKNKYLNLE